MKNYFSKNLYIQGLKKIRVSGLAFSLVIILLNAFLPIIGIAENGSYSSNRVPELITYNMVVPFCLLIMVLVPIIAHDMFSFLNERNQSDFYHAIPQKRTCVYISLTASVLTWAFGTVIVSTFINTLLWSFARFYTVSFSVILLGMLPYLVLSVLMSGVMILAMTVTGTRISNFLIAILIFLFFRVMGVLCITMLSEMSPILNVDNSICKYFGIRFFLPFALFEGIFDNEAEAYLNAGLQIYTLLVGIGLLSLGCWAYNARKSESATKSAPSKWLQHLYRFAVTLPFVFIIALFVVTDGFESYQFILVIIAFLVYVLYELITTKKIKNVLKSLPLLLIPIIVTVIIVSALSLVGSAIENDRPEAEDIVGFSYIKNYDRTYEGINTADIFVNNPEAAKIISDAFDYTVDLGYRGYNYRYQQVFVKLKSGRIMARNLYFTDEAYNRLNEIRVSAPEFSEAYLKIPHPDEVTDYSLYNNYGILTADVRKEVYESFYNEYQTLSDADKRWVKSPKGEFTHVSQIGVNGYIDSTRYNASYYLLFEKMPVTTIKYLNLISENKGYGYYGGAVENYYLQLQKCAGEAENGNVAHAYGTFDISPVSGTFPDGKLSHIYKFNESSSVVDIYKIFDIIISDDDCFAYDDINKVYKIDFYVEVELKSKLPVSQGEETTSIKYYGEDFVDEYIIPEVYASSFYMNEEFFVKLSDEKLAKIFQIMNNAYVKE